MCAKHGGVPQAATGLSAAREEAERQRTLDKSHTPILWMFLNDSPDGLSFLTHLLFRPFLKNKRSIYSTEGKIVCHYVLCINLAAFTLDVVEWSTLWVNVYEVYVRVEPAFVHHVDCEPAFCTTAGTEDVADVALC